MAMQIRPATVADTPAVIDLLRLSLGEFTIPKSEALWLWKHEQNPFGPSYVLLAEENNTLIGLRAFMKWEWERKGFIYKAIRAVDTATHPEHQGKGIFKKLTLQQVEVCKKQGVHFVFNTPNEQSKPGYLKMGWVEQGKMPLKFKLLTPFSMLHAKVFDKNKYPSSAEDFSPFQKWTNAIFDLPETTNYEQKTDQLTTVLSPHYLSWRYANNPLFRYNYFTDNENFLLISRIKNQSFTKELRLVDFILLNPRADHGYVNGRLREAVLPFCQENKIGFISFSGQQYLAYKPCFKWMGILPVRAMGPIITLCDLNMNENFRHLLFTKNWRYSIGDLELF